MIPVVGIAGAHSSCGKTSLAALLLRGPCQGFGAVKVTPVEGAAEVVTDPERLLLRGKDTCIMSEAGASRVLWVRSPRDGIPAVWGRVKDLLAGLPGILVEGNSAVDFVNPALVLFVLDLSGPVKETARGLLGNADAWVVNRRKGSSGAGCQREPCTALLADRGGAQGPVFFTDLARENDDTGRLLAFVRSRVGTASDR